MKWLNETDLIVGLEDVGKVTLRQVGWLGQKGIFYSLSDSPKLIELEI